MAIAIRQATAADAAILSSLNADVQALHSSALPWRFKPPGPETFPPAAAAALLAQPENLMFIAEVDSLPVGYAYARVVHRLETPLSYAHEMVYLHHLSVRESHRRQGVDGALIEHIHAAARGRGIELLAVDVWAFNDEARTFFRRHGFDTYNERLWRRQARPSR